MIVEFTRSALLDVKEIVAHLKEATTIERARKIRKEIFDATKRLKKHPQLGRLDEKRKNKNAEVRYLIHSPY
jgi:plasmid stabilization system protein ParE